MPLMFFCPKLTKGYNVLRTVLCVSLLVLGCKGQEDEYSKTETLLRKTLDSMSSALQFMELEHRRLNLDAIIGLRLVEGQLEVLLKHISPPGGHKFADDIIQHITALQQEAGQISDQAIPYVEKKQSGYYDRIGFIIQDGFWDHDYPSRDINLSLAEQPRVIGEAMREAESDKCLEELRTDKRSTNYDCEVTLDCWNRMTGKGYRYYSLSHEVFYLQIGESTGCFRGQILTNADKLSSKFCANMYMEARSISDDGFQSTKQDLFMEEAALCGIYGYRQFFDSDWLEKILSWQRQSSGCWGMTADDYLHGRSKREERVLPNGCECHRTAVAIAALTQYVRFMTERMHSLSGYDFF